MIDAEARAREAARELGEAVERSPEDARLRHAHALKAIMAPRSLQILRCRRARSATSSRGRCLRRRIAPARARGDALRVGYLSADFHEHATAHLAAGMFEAHDHHRLTPFAYALGGDDGSKMREAAAACT